METITYLCQTLNVSMSLEWKGDSFESRPLICILNLRISYPLDWMARKSGLIYLLFEEYV